MPHEPRTPRKSKKPRPTFDVARAEVGTGRAGWVYRSDAELPVELESSAAPPASTLERSEAARAELTHSFPAAPTPAPPPQAQPAASAAAGWIETGVGVMMLPFTLAIVAMVAPMLWVFGSRRK